MIGPSTLAWLQRLAVAGLLATASLAAQAANLTIAPVRLALDERQQSTRFDVQNRGGEAVVIQIEAQAWRQTDSGEVLEQTDEVIVNPPLFRLEPGQRQVVRVGMRSRERAASERAYRVYVTEVPKAGFDDPGLQVSMRMGLPLFVAPAPANAAAPQLTWTVQRTALGAIELGLRNQGLRHARFDAIRLQDAQSTIELASVGVTYVLPGASRRWRFDRVDQSARRWQVQAIVDGQATTIAIAGAGD